MREPHGGVRRAAAARAVAQWTDDTFVKDAFSTRAWRSHSGCASGRACGGVTARASLTVELLVITCCTGIGCQGSHLRLSPWSPDHEVRIVSSPSWTALAWFASVVLATAIVTLVSRLRARAPEGAASSAETADRDARQRLAVAAQAARIGDWWYDPERDTVWLSPAARHLFRV